MNDAREGAAQGTEGKWNERQMWGSHMGRRGSFLRSAFRTQYVSDDVGNPGFLVSRQQKRGAREGRETCNGESKYTSVGGNAPDREKEEGTEGA